MTVTGINLSPLSSLAATGNQQSPSNTERRSDIRELVRQTKRYAKRNGHYPSMTELNSNTWRSVYLKHIDMAIFANPSNPDNTQLKATQTKGYYSYFVSDIHNQSCEVDDTVCAQYTFIATYEGSVRGATTFIMSGHL